MDWKLHVISSLVIFVAVSLVFPLGIPLSAASLLAFLFFSLFPDIDHPKSLIRKITFFLLFYFLAFFVAVCLVAGFPEKIVIISISSLLTYFLYKKIPLHHRGRRSLHRWRHAVLLLIVFSAISVFLNISLIFSLFVLLGYSSHLLFDRIREF